jgi:hypothetical protein
LHNQPLVQVIRRAATDRGRLHCHCGQRMFEGNPVSRFPESGSSTVSTTPHPRPPGADVFPRAARSRTRRRLARAVGAALVSLLKQADGVRSCDAHAQWQRAAAPAECSSQRRHTAVHEQQGAGDVGGILGGQKQDGGGDLLGPAGAL